MPTVHYLTECTSTNDIIDHFISPKDIEISTVYTFRQTQGRGTYGNSWKGVPGEGIAFSMAIPERILGQKSLRAILWTAIVSQQFLSQTTGEELWIKWPNDLILREKKVGGILIEKRKIQGQEYYIFGIGINVLQKKIKEFPQGGSLFTQTQKKYDLHKLAQGLHEKLICASAEIESEEILLSRYNKLLFRKDLISVFEIKKIRQNGIIRGMDTEGKLIVELENDGFQSFFHKEIQLLY